MTKMNNEENFDTADVLNDKDYQEINEIKEIRKRILSYINIDVFIDTCRNIIEESHYVNFKNERSKKFINNKRPVFYLHIDKDVMKSKEYNKKKFKSNDEEIKYFSDVLYSEIIVKITSFINNSIKEDNDDSNELKEYISSTSLFEGLPSKEDDASFYDRLSIISAMYGIRLDKDDASNITLEILL
jgi:hypothetical protein